MRNINQIVFLRFIFIISSQILVFNNIYILGVTPNIYLIFLLIFPLNYNKSFYRDGILEPTKTLSFLIRIIPFTEFGVPNLGELINN